MGVGGVNYFGSRGKLFDKWEYWVCVVRFWFGFMINGGFCVLSGLHLLDGRETLQGFFTFLFEGCPG
jgi:hypothetical protein